MSRGAYRVVGDTYRFTLPRPYPSAISDTTSYGSINNYILSSMDIDFSIYDNWTFSNYNHVNQPDGLVDMVFIAYRSPLNGVRLDPPVNVYGPSEGFSGISGLLTSYTSDDVLPSGQHIVVSNGTTQGSCLSGHLVARDIILHALGHKLIRGGSVGDHTGRIANLGLLNANQVGFDASKGMCAWERELLGWIDYTTISSDAIVTLHDMITTSEPPYALKIPTANPDRYYVIENRQGSSIFDATYDKGIYIYRVSEQSAGGITGIQSTQVYNPRNVPEPGGTGSWSPQNITGNNYDGLVNVLCADGRWNFEKSRGSSCYPTITTSISAHSTKASPSMKSKRNTPSPVLSRPRQSC